MRLVLPAVSGSTQLSGVTRHAANLARCLLRFSDIGELHLIAAPWEHAMLREAIAMEDPRLYIHCVHLDRTDAARAFWYFFDLPEVAAQLGANVVHLSHPAPLSRRKMQCPVLVTVHDLIPLDSPEDFGFLGSAARRMILRQCIQEAEALVCVSDATLDRLQRCDAKAAEKATRIYNSVESSRMRTGRSPAAPCNNVPFLLSVAEQRRSKNIVTALRALARLLRERAVQPEMLLVVVGARGPETRRIERCIEAEGMGRSVLLLSGISETELQWCYRNCEALLAPSLMEGFGLPIAEGLLVGSRVVCSDIAPFREAGGGHCRYVALGEGEVERFAVAIRETLKQPRAGPVALPRFEGKTIAGEWMALYRKLAEGRGRLTTRAKENEDRWQAVGTG